MKLYLDTSKRDEIEIKLVKNDKSFNLSKKVEPRNSQAVLVAVEELLTAHRVSIQDIDELYVKTGPGSFTGLRIGLSIANALSAFLNIPVNGEKPGTIIDAKYI